MTIIVLGGGCSRCNQLAENARKAADALGFEYRLVQVKDIQEIMKYGVLVLPALVLGGKVVVSGRVPSLKEVQRLFSDFRRVSSDVESATRATFDDSATED
jgi:small redox-active disulfide protein 2